MESTRDSGDLRGYEGRSPPSPNSFHFMQFLGKFGKIVCWHPPGSWRPLLGEILDPPLPDMYKCSRMVNVVSLWGSAHKITTLSIAPPSYPAPLYYTKCEDSLKPIAS